MQNEIAFIHTEVGTNLPLPFAEFGAQAGFPSPAQDYMELSLDFNRDMIQHPEATFYARVKGESMRDAGIHNGDILVIDRSLSPKHDSIVVAMVDGEFTVKKLHKKGGVVELHPANPEFSVIEITEGMDFEVWGVVAYSIKAFR
ncbi:LexA family protein [Chitinivibrio alkaliphilus]|uniref:Peptidase S24 LexA-like protein n=1 Tax=Chitinivibrio alkaliphilus ACht1 TaxID=1313304 RepID=U7D6J9_9BACT|nr:translesion error-prone DNA polymerase V autoproteolytic subunit [Chitinivibrio alkaliphilus]ERP30712.1 Peptidase S24 LexA-like protein [Chitinivibrio alkaliphilus ACht1]